MLLETPADSWFWLALSSLVVWRTTMLLVYETGPFDLLRRVRKLAGSLGLERAFECFHCVSLWIAILVVPLVYIPDLATPFLILAVAGNASLLERWLAPPEVDLEEE